MLRTVNVTRYVTPLREGGSLPALAEADDEFLYVLKFRGSGQGPKSLIAELIGGELACVLGLKVPELVYAQLDEAFGRTEPDEEIQDLLKFSVGKNLALHYLSGAITFDSVVDKIDARTASQIVWLDSLITNMDRTCKNTNMLMWKKQLWLIDHGAALYFHHSSSDGKASALKPFKMIKDHALLKQASELTTVDKEYKKILTDEKILQITALIPEEWLNDELPKDEQRRTYFDFLSTRLAHSHTFVQEANHERESII